MEVVFETKPKEEWKDITTDLTFELGGCLDNVLVRYDNEIIACLFADGFAPEYNSPKGVAPGYKLETKLTQHGHLGFKILRKVS